MEILRTGLYRLASIDWPFYVFWLTYFSVMVGLVAYLTG